MKSKLFFVIFFAITTMVSCKKDKNNNTLPQLTFTSTTVTADQTIDEANYLIDHIVEVTNGAVLTIPAGAILTFTDQGGFITSNGGAIKAIGTASAPILFTGKEAIKGYWIGIDINTNSLNNVFTYCTFEYGGQNRTMVRLGGDNSEICRALFTYCKFSKSGKNGLYLNEQSTITGSGNNAFTDNTQYPAWLTYENIIDLNNSNTYSGNAKNKIYVESGDYNINKDVSFNKIAIPYYLNHTTGDPLKRIYHGFTLNPGVVIEIAPNMLFEIESTGSFHAVGTISDSIIIRGGERVSGYWDKIRFVGSPSSENQFEYCKISDGGSYYDSNWDDKGMITIKNIYDAKSRISINNCWFSNSLYYGIDLFQCTSSGATVVNGVKGAANIKTAVESVNGFPSSTATDKNISGNVRTTD